MRCRVHGHKAYILGHGGPRIVMRRKQLLSQATGDFRMICVNFIDCGTLEMSRFI